MNDEILEFSTEELKTEIRRRELVFERGVCWYCNKDLLRHDCKFAAPRHLGWEFEDPKFVRIENKGGYEIGFWWCTADNVELGKRLMIGGPTKIQAIMNMLSELDKNNNEGAQL